MRFLAPVPRILLLLAVLSCSACAGLRESSQLAPLIPSVPVTEDKATQIWQLFSARAGATDAMSGPFRISGTLRYSTPRGDNNRVSFLLWGNGDVASQLPLRLDILAGAGTVVARAREASDLFLIYAPNENKVYEYAGEAQALVDFGVPVPLSLSDLTLLLTGRTGALFIPSGPDPARVPDNHRLTDKGAVFVLPNASLPGEVELSSSGAPLAWSEANQTGWRMELDPGDPNPLQPRRLRVTHPEGWSALIIIREIARVSPPYTIERLSLQFPPGVERTTLPRTK